MAYCFECKERFDAPGGFCPFCGETLKPEPADSSHPTKKPGPMVSKIRDAQAMPRGRARGAYDYLIGRTLEGRYKIERRLGEGGMGVVFLAVHTIIERKVAIKVLKRDVVRDDSVLERFLREAKSASKIEHPNIVDVTDFGTTDDGMPYSVMEYVDGPALNQVLRKGPLALERAVRIAIQIASALAAAHKQGVIHRDLKPGNIFLTGRGAQEDIVKVGDFGIAKVVPVDGNAEGRKLTRAGAIFGTPEYMSPEQAAGRSDIDRRVDIYSLGTILYEMLVGRVPHRGETIHRTIAMQLMDPITPPRIMRPDLAISDELEALILRALAKDRDARYGDMSELAADLSSVTGVRVHTRVRGDIPASQKLPATPPGSAQSGVVRPVAPDDPAFLGSSSRLPAYAQDADRRGHGKRSGAGGWIWAIVVMAVAAAVTVTVLYLVRNDGLGSTVMTTPVDANLVFDSSSEQTIDAKVEDDIDAPSPSESQWAEVRIRTKPRGGTISVRGDRSPSSVIRGRIGTTVTVRCQSGPRKGKVRVRFRAGTRRTKTCVMACPEGLLCPDFDSVPK